MPTNTKSNNPLSYKLSDNDIEFLLKQAKAGVVAAEDLADVSDASGVRTLDGFGNNVENPLWGNADQTFKRLGEIDFENGVDEPRDGPLPRKISNLILNQNKDGETNNFGPNLMQSLDHLYFRSTNRCLIGCSYRMAWSVLAQQGGDCHGVRRGM